jgi:Zn-dependent protease
MKAFFLILLSGLKWGKLAASGGSMLLSLLVYATIWGWQYAAGFVGLLFAHETGHYIAARQRGLNVGAPAFIPFVGAWIALKDEPVDVETEAYIAIAGPVVGTIAALAVYLWARSENSGLLLAISYSGLFLNLFNLLPISPFDGGRVTAVLSPRIWFLGVPILLALMLYRPSPMLIVVAILAAPQLLKAWRYDPKAPENLVYYGVTLQTKFEYGAAYLALAALLAIMTYDVHEMLGSIAHPA